MQYREQSLRLSPFACSQRAEQKEDCAISLCLQACVKRETDWANQLFISQFVILRCDQKQCFNSLRSCRDIWAWHQEHGNCLEVSGSDHTIKIIIPKSKRFAPRNQQNRCARLDKCFNKARDVDSLYFGSSTRVRVSQLYICIQIRIYIHIQIQTCITLITQTQII